VHPLGEHLGNHCEARAWRGVSPGWTPLFGSFEHLGFSLEAHDFSLKNDLDWSPSFHPGSVELCVNLEGEGELSLRGRKTRVEPGTAVFYRIGPEPIAAARFGAGRHRFITLECRRDWLLRTLAGQEVAMEPLIRDGLLQNTAGTMVGNCRPVAETARGRFEELWKPPVVPPARPLWFQGRVLEIVSEFFYPPAEEFFCDRQKRLARERMNRAREILESNLAEPPPLEELSRRVGVSQFYLSRIFSQEMRMTIPQFLRQARVQKAAGMLAAGTHNVTEAAFAVGYSSLGHFSKSFCEVMGCCPTLYPQARALRKH
jgi:AraC-like DNA-binding protein